MLSLLAFHSVRGAGARSAGLDGSVVMLVDILVDELGFVHLLLLVFHINPHSMAARSEMLRLFMRVHIVL